MKRFITGLLAVGLLFTAASCSSDSKSSSATAGGADTSGLDDLHAQVYAMALQVVATKGVKVDEACVKAILDQLSAADAKLIVDAGPTGNPKLSAAGDALGAKLPTCTLTPTT